MISYHFLDIHVNIKNAICEWVRDYTDFHTKQSLVHIGCYFRYEVYNYTIPHMDLQLSFTSHWSLSVWNDIYNCMIPNGFVTFCAKRCLLHIRCFRCKTKTTSLTKYSCNTVSLQIFTRSEVLLLSFHIKNNGRWITLRVKGCKPMCVIIDFVSNKKMMWHKFYFAYKVT